ncbi:MAG: acyl-CoA thioesterase [Pseudomonadota bacterium]
MTDQSDPKGELTLRAVAMPSDANVGGDMFGGWLMGMMDLGASVIARQRARCRTATVACHRIDFLAPVRVGDLVSNHAWLIREGRSSMRIGAEVWVRREIWGDPERVAEAEFTFVALTESGTSRPLPTQEQRT